MSYNQSHQMSDSYLLKKIGSYVKHYRVSQNRSQEDTARDAGISRSTLSLLERGKTVRTDTLMQVLRVLDLLHIIDIFKIGESVSPVQYAKLKKNERQRAGRQTGDINYVEDPGW